MYAFRDPEWQLHIPQKAYITIVLTHLIAFLPVGPFVGSQSQLCLLARRFPLLT
jgi:hypothetical protein